MKQMCGNNAHKLGKRDAGEEGGGGEGEQETCPLCDTLRYKSKWTTSALHVIYLMKPLKTSPFMPEGKRK